ncbi:hypothetical protein ASF93_08595 [Microbacterium sp. Leaf347]|nr:hypothetical protein ASF93_08595 [Microbacterium sp. Leaf347]KQS00033.1 hypothetical protein ASG00_11135 [Microbacterium sp. Leaf351]OJU75263.1 MAG: hypothetical protein BGO15_04365 [Microbacterium sp. 71-23]OSP10433.1 hypothetical protein B7W94_00200 [Microbacterium sp. LEMMJ01]
MWQTDRAATRLARRQDDHACSVVDERTGQVLNSHRHVRMPPLEDPRLLDQRKLKKPLRQRHRRD